MFSFETEILKFLKFTARFHPMVSSLAAAFMKNLSGLGKSESTFEIIEDKLSDNHITIPITDHLIN